MFRNKYLLVLIILILVITHILWDYFNGGVPVHYVLANNELPGISNWWGLLTVPILSWVLLSLIYNKIESESTSKSHLNKVIFSFIMSLLFGVLLSAFWEFKMDFVTQYLILLPIILSVFVKVHKPECLLGFVLGMVYTFGGVLPVGFGLVILTMSFITNLILNQGTLYLISKFK